MTMTGPQIATHLEELLPDQAGVERAAAELPEHIANIRGWLLGWIAAWNARDVDAIADQVTDDIVYDDPGMWGELVQGKAAFRENISMVFRGFPDLRFVPADWPPMVSLDGRHFAAPGDHQLLRRPRRRPVQAGDRGNQASPRRLLPRSLPVPRRQALPLDRAQPGVRARPPSRIRTVWHHALRAGPRPTRHRPDHAAARHP
jgi:hypothetical protein